METVEKIDLDSIFNSSSTTEASSEITLADVELEMKKEELESRKQDRKQRGLFSIWIFGFMGLYMVFILLVLVLSGCKILIFEESVLISLLTTTTADVIGVFIIVAKYLFHKSD